MEEEYSSISNIHICVNIFEITIPGAHPTIQCRDDSGIHEFDRAMANVFIGLS